MSPLLPPAVQKICSSSITQVSVSPAELFPCNALLLCSSTQLLRWVSRLIPHLLSRLPSDSLNPHYLYQHAISIGHVFIFMTAQIDLLTLIYYVHSHVCMCARGGRRTICRNWFSSSTTIQILRRLKLMVSGLVASALTAWATSVVPQRDSTSAPR